MHSMQLILIVFSAIASASPQIVIPSLDFSRKVRDEVAAAEEVTVAWKSESFTGMELIWMIEMTLIKMGPCTSTYLQVMLINLIRRLFVVRVAEGNSLWRSFGCRKMLQIRFQVNSIESNRFASLNSNLRLISQNTVACFGISNWKLRRVTKLIIEVHGKLSEGGGLSRLEQREI